MLLSTNTQTLHYQRKTTGKKLSETFLMIPLCCSS